MPGAESPQHEPKTFIVRILRRERDTWQGQLVDVRAGEIHPFHSFLHLQRLLLTLGDATSVAMAVPAEGVQPRVGLAGEA